MSVPRDRARQTNPEPDNAATQNRLVASYSDLGVPQRGREYPARSDVIGNEVLPMRPYFRPDAQGRSPARAPWSDGAARPALAIQKREIVFLLSGFGLVLGLALVVTALALVLVPSLFSSPSPGPPVAAGPPIVTSPSTTSAPTTFARFVAIDTATQGTWQNVYGGAGYLVAGDTQKLPATIHVTPSGTSLWVWGNSTTDPRAVVRPENPSDRIAACWFSTSTFTLDVNITDGHPYQVALYVLDWDTVNPRYETVSVVDPSSGAALDTRQLRVFGIGEYVVWQVRGHVTIRVTNNGSINAAASGLFFVPATPAPA